MLLHWVKDLQPDLLPSAESRKYQNGVSLPAKQGLQGLLWDENWALKYTQVTFPFDGVYS